MAKRKTATASQVLAKLRKMHSSKSKSSDRGQAHKVTKSLKQLTASNLRRWTKRPGSMDIRGVDTRKKRVTKRRRK